MRSLHEVLPIVREVLKESSHLGGGCQPYTCIAAMYAWEMGLITRDEYEKLVYAIERELSPYPTIYASMRLSFQQASLSPNFWPLRDKWLDDFQEKLERLAGEYDPEKEPPFHPAHD